jgi:hypothetical protein
MKLEWRGKAEVSRELVMDVMRYGDSVDVKGPNDLRAHLAQELTNEVARYTRAHVSASQS